MVLYMSYEIVTNIEKSRSLFHLIYLLAPMGMWVKSVGFDPPIYLHGPIESRAPVHMILFITSSNIFNKKFGLCALCLHCHLFVKDVYCCSFILLLKTLGCSDRSLSAKWRWRLVAAS